MKRGGFILAMLATLMSLSATGQTNVIYIDDFEINPDSTVTVPLMLANQDTTRGVQFNLTLPETMDLDLVELTEYSKRKGFTSSFSYSDGTYTVMIYQIGEAVFPPDTTAIALLTFYAYNDFNGGEVVVWKCRGSTTDNNSIIMDGDTAQVTVPTSSLVDIEAGSAPVSEQYFNLMGQPISSPDSVPVAVQVTTTANGQRTSRKVSVRP